MQENNAVAYLEEFCEFGKNRVYLFTAVARTKENPELTSSTEVVFREVITSKQNIRRKYEKLRSAADQYPIDVDDRLTFRLYITVNPRNTLDAYFNFRQRMNSWVKDQINGDEAAMEKFKQVDRYWKSELQKPEAREKTLFLFDLDDVNEDSFNGMRSSLVEHAPICTWQETPNGYHIITEPFNYNELESEVEYEVNNPGSGDPGLVRGLDL